MSDSKHFRNVYVIIQRPSGNIVSCHSSEKKAKTVVSYLNDSLLLDFEYEGYEYKRLTVL